jgi:hypothetical protein
MLLDQRTIIIVYVPKGNSTHIIVHTILLKLTFTLYKSKLTQVN